MYIRCFFVAVRKEAGKSNLREERLLFGLGWQGDGVHPSAGGIGRAGMD